MVSPMVHAIKRGGEYMLLTANQEKFVQCIIEGMSQADAYRTAYPKQRCSDKTIWENASRIYNNSKVQARLKELRDQLAKPSIMTAQERLEWLTKLIQSDEETTADKLKASDQMNKMQGEYKQQISAEINVKRLEDLI